MESNFNGIHFAAAVLTIFIISKIIFWIIGELIIAFNVKRNLGERVYYWLGGQK